MEKALSKTISLVPHEPGVYIYKNAAAEVIYVGKARDLSRRIKQYFQNDNSLDEKTRRLVSDIVTVDTIPTTSEFDALLLEAKLIRTHMPKYNVVSRDDKSPLYVVITLAEELPRLLLVRKGEIKPYESKRKNRIYGPFQSGYALRAILRQLRSIVPYCTQKERRGRPCFYTHLGLCDPCPSEIVRLEGEAARKRETARYRKHMLQLRNLFEGNTRYVSRNYEREMRRLATSEQFEAASLIKERLHCLNSLSSHRYDPQVFLERGAQDVYEEELKELVSILGRVFPDIHSLERIECFDISNLFGEHAVGSMVVLIHGKPAKGEYRRFRIKTVRGISDVAMMQEVLTRRLKHDEWPYPQFLLVDGGKAQVDVATAIMHMRALDIPVAGLAKRDEELIIPKRPRGFTTLRLPLSGKAIKVLMRIRDEAHRFAITYHRKLRTHAFLSARGK